MSILSFLLPKFVEETDEQGRLIGRGELKNGCKWGVWREFHPETGTLSAEGVYRNGKYGTWFYYDPLTRRTVAFGAYFKDKPVGTWHVLNVSKGVFEEIRYQPLLTMPLADRSGYIRLYNLDVYKTMPLPFNNQVYMSCEGRTYGHFCFPENFVPDGKGKKFYENGQVEAVINYDKGRRHGPYQTFYLSGQVKTKGQYEFREPHGEWTSYDSDGKIAHIVSYDRGEVLSEEKLKDLTVQNPYAVTGRRRVTSYRPWPKRLFTGKEKTHD